MSIQYAKTAYVDGWGSDRNARRVHGLTEDERKAIRNGQEIRLTGCPVYHGETERKIVEIGGRFYCRMP
jgi:hypothetical protein